MMVPFDHGRYLSKSLLKLAKRHDPSMSNEALALRDDNMKNAYLRTFTVLMYEFELGEVEKNMGAFAGMSLKFKALELVRPIL